MAPSLRGFSGYTDNGLVTSVSVVAGHASAAISTDGQAVLIHFDDFTSATISYAIDGKYTARISINFLSSLFLGSS